MKRKKTRLKQHWVKNPSSQPPPHCPQQEYWEWLKAYWTNNKSIEKAIMSYPHSFTVYLKTNHIVALIVFFNLLSWILTIECGMFMYEENVKSAKDCH